VNTLLGIFVSSYVIALSGAVVPGPVLSATISESIKGDVWAGPMIVLGHGILELCLIVMLVAGFAEFINNVRLLSMVGFAGGLYLLWLAFIMLKNVNHIQVNMNTGNTVRGGSILSGIVTSIANPYWIIWWATIGLGYVIVSMKYGLIGVTIFFMGHILADFSWYSMVSILICRGKKFLSSSVYRRIYGGCAILLGFFGFTFTVWGIKQIVEFVL